MIRRLIVLSLTPWRSASSTLLARSRSRREGASDDRCPARRASAVNGGSTSSVHNSDLTYSDVWDRQQAAGGMSMRCVGAATAVGAVLLTVSACSSTAVFGTPTAADPTVTADRHGIAECGSESRGVR